MSDIRDLRGKELEEAILASEWYAQPNDLIGGWCLMTVPLPPSSGHPEIGDFFEEYLAKYVAEIHNKGLNDYPYAPVEGPTCGVQHPEFSECKCHRAPYHAGHATDYGNERLVWLDKYMGESSK